MQVNIDTQFTRPGLPGFVNFGASVWSDIANNNPLTFQYEGFSLPANDTALPTLQASHSTRSCVITAAGWCAVPGGPAQPVLIVVTILETATEGGDKTIGWEITATFSITNYWTHAPIWSSGPTKPTNPGAVQIQW